MKSRFLFLAALVLCGCDGKPPAKTAAPTPAPAVTAAPMETKGPHPAFPRLTQFADAKIMAAVNAQLAEREAKARVEESACYANLKKERPDSKSSLANPDPDKFSLSTRVTYLSARYLGVAVHQEDDCGGMHPNAGNSAVTYDLTTGTELDWRQMFKPGFFPPPDAADMDPPPPMSPLQRIYEKNYQPHDDCQAVLDLLFAHTMGFRLDKDKGVVAQLHTGSMMDICAMDEVVMPIAELAPYLNKPGLAEDLKQ